MVGPAVLRRGTLWRSVCTHLAMMQWQNYRCRSKIDRTRAADVQRPCNCVQRHKGGARGPHGMQRPCNGVGLAAHDGLGSPGTLGGFILSDGSSSRGASECFTFGG
jgi:hypothetical protein